MLRSTYSQILEGERRAFQAHHRSRPMEAAVFGRFVGRWKVHYALQLQTGCQLGPELQSLPSYLKEIQSSATKENEVSCEWTMCKLHRNISVFGTVSL